jgi:hypothetical protein
MASSFDVSAPIIPALFQQFIIRCRCTCNAHAARKLEFVKVVRVQVCCNIKYVSIRYNMLGRKYNTLVSDTGRTRVLLELLDKGC